MWKECLQIYTDIIPVYNCRGKKIDEIVLKEKIKPVPRRRCGFSDRGVYYKGAGIVYTGHYVNEYDESLKLVANTGAEYEKYNVINSALFRKFGIFTFRHQPCFSDFEGGCGKKERQLLVMQDKFELSAISEIAFDTPFNLCSSSGSNDAPPDKYILPLYKLPFLKYSLFNIFL